MALKKARKTMVSDEEKFLQLMNEVKDLDKQISALRHKRGEIYNEMLEIKIKPFKVGQIVLAEISCGRNKKWCECLIECERGTLYLRPKKENGYSKRHFSLIPVGGKTYTDYLKEVK